MTRDGRKTEDAPGGGGKAAQEVLDVGLVARALAPEHIGVDDHQGRHASSRYTDAVASAAERHENAAARAGPRRASSSPRLIASPMPAAIDSASVGSTSTAAPSATSAIAVPLLVTTGAPHASASSTGIPKPSYSDGYVKQSAPR